MTSSFSVRFKLSSPPFRPHRPRGRRRRIGSSDRPDGRYADPLAKQGTLQKRSRLGGSGSRPFDHSPLWLLALGVTRARCLGPGISGGTMPPEAPLNLSLPYPCAAVSSAVSSLMPGPMVVLTVTFLT